MIFQPELAAKVLDGSKTVTRRPVKDNEDGSLKPCRYRPGRPYAVQVPQTDGRGKGRGGKAVGHIEVVGVNRQRLYVGIAGPGSDEAEARREGFEYLADFTDYWIDLYGSWEPFTLVDRIEFRLIDPDDYLLWESGGRRI